MMHSEYSVTHFVLYIVYNNFFCQVGRFIKYPCIKFIGHAISFITFLVMIVVSSVSERPNITNRNFSKIGEVVAYNNYKDFRLNKSDIRHSCSKSHIQEKLPFDFALRTYEPEVIHMLLTLWIIGKSDFAIAINKN